MFWFVIKHLGFARLLIRRKLWQLQVPDFNAISYGMIITIDPLFSSGWPGRMSKMAEVVC